MFAYNPNDDSPPPKHLIVCKDKETGQVDGLMGAYVHRENAEQAMVELEDYFPTWTDLPFTLHLVDVSTIKV